MSATSAPESEQTSPHETYNSETIEIKVTTLQGQDSSFNSHTSPNHDDVSAVSNPHSAIKVEDTSGGVQHDDEASETVTTLRPDPHPSIRRRESEAADTAATAELGDRPNKKRKRGASPPWQLGTVEAASVKTADGRRISARVNVGTPGMSESEGQGRGRSASQSMARSRPPSPPWKKFEAEGPTSLHVDGVRKSGRVNKELTNAPKRTSPRQKKQADKLAEEKKASVRPASRGTVVQVDGGADVRPPTSAKSRRSLSPASRIAELQAQIAALQPTSSFPSPEVDVKHANAGHKRKRSDDATPRIRRPSSPISNRKPHRPSNVSLSPTVTRPTPKIKLRFSGKRPFLPPQHPHAVSSPPARPPQLSIYQVIESYELQELQQPYMENERGPPGVDFFRSKNERLAVEEAEVRKKLVKAAQSGGALSREECIIYRDERQEEPSQQYGHVDHLASQASYFRSLQQREKNQHRTLAKKVAYEALERWKQMRGPTEEDIIAEQNRIFRLIYKQVVLDVRAKWETVSAHVQQLRKERWEAEEDARRQERLRIQLEQAEAMIAKQRGVDDTSDVDMDEDSTGDVPGSETSDEKEEEEVDSGEENMSESESEAGSTKEDDPGDMPEEDLAAYKRFKADQKNGEATATTGEGLEEPTAAGAAAAVVTVARDGIANGATDPDHEEPAKPTSAAAAVVEDRVTTVGDEVANYRVVSASKDHQDGGLQDTAALLGRGDDDEVEDEQDEYMPDADREESGNDDLAAEDAVKPEFSATPSRRRSRRSHSVDVETADDGLDLSDDESENMYDSDEDMSSTDDEDEAESPASDSEQENDADVEEAQNSYLSLYYDKAQIKNALGLPTPTTSAGGDEQDPTGEAVSDENADAQAGAVEALHGTKAEDAVAAHGMKPEELLDHATPHSPAPVDSVAPEYAPCSPSMEAPSAVGVKQMVPVPFLLRGTLRSYQHAGLDWLASLHRSGINGILADEMGLGKTIQTIALLAHLAELNDVWETHLVIVPTSVILNWVNEFHKFLPGFRVLGYYGSSEERSIKRRGWVNDPHHEDREKRGYNVVVTSYNVAMQDINAIRNVQWHYLVLDEAHNIRNFQSQRWQSLIRLKTKARLLLTGTPLQNSLTELWSLLTFLTAGDDDPAHGDLEEFLSHWKEPVKEIFDRGVSSLSNEAQKVVDQLHVSLRPFLLRRLKSEVEKDLPKKTESVVVCKLSKRQRQLYQEYMSLASTRESLAKGNAVSAGRVLLSLRRVCNHPDLFDPRPIQTSYAMELSPIEPFAVKERLVRTLLVGEEDKSMPAGLMIIIRENRKKGALKRSKQLAATSLLRRQVHELEQKATQTPDLSTPAGCLALQKLRQRERKLEQLRDCIQVTEASLSGRPMHGSDLRELLTVKTGRPYQVTHRGRHPHEHVRLLRAWLPVGQRPLQYEHLSDWYLSQHSSLQQDVLSLERYAENFHEIINRFAFCTPVATAPVFDQAITPRSQKLLRASDAYPATSDFAHEARSRTSIVFPDSRLLIYDSGKLQRLSKLLRELQAKGSRSLIFTQMTGTLNILEQFLNLLGLPYLRLDGSTPPERRMLYSSEFNRPDSKYQCMILSSRAGGVGLNLTGASSVIFYDLDWNPQMDRQCMDRAHRIGQVRDVEVYKMVSEKTVEENILRRATQKSLLDQTVIQEGHFTTEYQQPARQAGAEDADGNEVTAAIERFLGGGDKTDNQAIASVEDREDVIAAEAARKEENQDAEEFAERSSKGPSAALTPGRGTIVEGDDDEDRKGHVDVYMVDLMETMLKDVPFVPPVVRKLDKHGRDPSHRPKRKR